MIDLHLHVLPAVDDGAADDFETRTMLERWAGFGFTELVSTPHLNGSLTPIYEAEVGDALERAAAMAEDLGISLMAGFEIMLQPDLPGRLESGERLSLGGSTAVLVEVPFLQWPSFTEDTIFGLQAAGFQPVLAHPERYAAVQDDPRRALALAGRGVVLQVTYASLAGVLGKPVQRTAELLLQSDAMMVLASDAHSNGRRLLAIPRGADRAGELVGDGRLRQLMVDNPAALLAGEALPDPVKIEPAESPAGPIGRVKRLFSASH
ncbi:tyrosine-protein phosphatase [soil metagenome]